MPYTESFMVASCDKNEKYLYVTDQFGTISHVLVSMVFFKQQIKLKINKTWKKNYSHLKASAVGRQSDQLTSFLDENYSSANKGILGAIDFALRTLCIICEPDAKFIEVTVTACNRPFEVSPE